MRLPEAEINCRTHWPPYPELGSALALGEIEGLPRVLDQSVPVWPNAEEQSTPPGVVALMRARECGTVAAPLERLTCRWQGPAYGRVRVSSDLLAAGGQLERLPWVRFRQPNGEVMSWDLLWFFLRGGTAEERERQRRERMERVMAEMRAKGTFLGYPVRFGGNEEQERDA